MPEAGVHPGFSKQGDVARGLDGPEKIRSEES
jgi:hypothetical protein